MKYHRDFFEQSERLLFLFLLVPPPAIIFNPFKSDDDITEALIPASGQKQQVFQKTT